MFELDFEANLPIVRSAAKYGKHLVFPSTSEVYGMCPDEQFDPENSELVVRPDQQAALDLRVLEAADGPRDLGLRHGRPELHAVPSVQLDRPGLDSIYTPKEGRSRVVTQFLGHIVRGENITLVDGGAQKRAFTYIDDGIDALMKIIENKDGARHRQDLQHRQPDQQLLDARTGAHDARSSPPSIPEYAAGAQQGAARRDQRRAPTTARATRTCRTACRRSTTRCRNSTGRRPPPWTTRCARSSTRIAARSAARALVDCSKD